MAHYSLCWRYALYSPQTNFKITIATEPAENAVLLLAPGVLLIMMKTNEWQKRFSNTNRSGLKMGECPTRDRCIVWLRQLAMELISRAVAQFRRWWQDNELGGKPIVYWYSWLDPGARCYGESVPAASSSSSCSTSTPFKHQLNW